MVSEVFCMDCMEYMRTIPDRFFDLALVDPPYGIGEDGRRNASRNHEGKATAYRPYTGNDADAPDHKFFNELKRISKNQIIWGANHFINRLPLPSDSSCWIVWNKRNGNSPFADCELAWTSFKTAVRMFSYRWNGMWQEDMKNKEKHIHPNQKPVALYEWILANYAKPGYKVFDSHLGSGSHRIAAYRSGLDFWGCEMDSHYYRLQEERFRKECLKNDMVDYGHTGHQANTSC